MPWKSIENQDLRIWCEVLPRPPNRDLPFVTGMCPISHEFQKSSKWTPGIKCQKNKVWSLQKSRKTKQHPKPVENLENAATKIPRNLDLGKARWRVLRAAALWRNSHRREQFQENRYVLQKSLDFDGNNYFQKTVDIFVERKNKGRTPGRWRTCIF